MKGEGGRMGLGNDQVHTPQLFLGSKYIQLNTAPTSLIYEIKLICISTLMAQYSYKHIRTFSID